MKKSALIVMVCLLLVGTFSLSAWAAPGGGPNPAGPQGRMAMFRGLNLTLEQQQKILTIRQDFEKDTLVLRNDLRQKRLELRQLWAADSLNQNSIDAKTKELNTLRIQMLTKMRTMRDKMKAVLTPEQLKKITDFVQKHDRKAFPQGMGGRGNGCWGGNF